MIYIIGPICSIFFTTFFVSEADRIIAFPPIRKDRIFDVFVGVNTFQRNAWEFYFTSAHRIFVCVYRLVILMFCVIVKNVKELLFLNGVITLVVLT